MDFLSAITPQIAVLGIGALVMAVVTFVLVSLRLARVIASPNLRLGPGISVGCCNWGQLLLGPSIAMCAHGRYFGCFLIPIFRAQRAAMEPHPLAARRSGVQNLNDSDIILLIIRTIMI
jgi:hypothetical protein